MFEGSCNIGSSKKENMKQELKDSFLKGNHEAIYAFGKKFMSANGMEAMPVNKVDEFIGGWSPQYLHHVGEGWGMSTADAIRCLFDYARTSKFILGIGQAIQYLKQVFPGERLVAVEAGTGTGILSVALVLAGVDQVEAIEINEVTAACAQNFVAEMNLGNRIKIVNADATKYKPKDKFHILLSENMHTGLFLEPQVQIVNHLKQDLLPGGVVIPEAVNLYFACAQANWDRIGAEQIELMNTNGHVKKVGEFGCLPRLVFAEAQPEQQVTIYLPNSLIGNALLTEMDVHIFGGLSLLSSEAKFLGQPHLTKCQIETGSGRFGGYFLFSRRIPAKKNNRFGGLIYEKRNC